MNKFEFENNQISNPLLMEINDRTYTCYPESNCVKLACSHFSEEIDKLQTKVNDKDLTQESLSEIMKDTYKLISETVDEVLGAGSYHEIFALRDADFSEHQKLICFLFDELKHYYEHSEDEADEHIN